MSKAEKVIISIGLFASWFAVLVFFANGIVRINSFVWQCSLIVLFMVSGFAQYKLITLGMKKYDEMYEDNVRVVGAKK